jgi:hypothetical protein
VSFENLLLLRVLPAISLSKGDFFMLYVMHEIKWTKRRLLASVIFNVVVYPGIDYLEMII